ncbi:hypothetical protein CTAM01_16078 [Colletotrichum tamarilloi]|uniref:Nephrocystin 3-like N-terminal domain-containing protein n=1 Tax=Colletotrichum tamarilloi TaxID=1209934 RepID=A0ABQ9QJK0_9PEZI|nr:uncharacterized protein CTAM01_16078 [Colletotrichum tamarilloi]KAK1473840.1 hypothetical protein CTAM01_16078 [Colletotrichum tamarilloi]
MDPVSAIGLATSVLTFIEFGTKVVNGTKQIYDATSGVKRDNATIETIVDDLQKLSTKLSGPDPKHRTESDKDLCELAAECKRLAEDLKHLLYRIKPKVKGSKWHSFVSALKNERFSGEKEELRVRLEACRGQLHFKLNYVTSRDTQDKLKDVIELSTSSNTRLGELQASIEQLRSSIQASGLDEATKGGLQKLLDIPEEKLDSVAQERVLNALKFDQMNHRFNQVSEAHAKTFKWLFSREENEEDFYEAEESKGEDFEKAEQEAEFTEDKQRGKDFCEEVEPKDEPSEGRESREEFYGEKRSKELSEEEEREEDIYEERKRQEESEAEMKCHEKELAREKQHEKERRETRRRFLDWLSSGSGVFHFSAKLGAGKSTLMKLIIGNPHVQDRLQQWAGDSRKLVLATHFFWKPGMSYLQKSFEGMCRALLYGVLNGRPELTRLLFPSHWKTAWSTPWQVSKELVIHDTEARKALEFLVEHSKVDGTFRFCFFIDGLDELEESTDVQHRHLARTLKEWSTRSSANIKFCVSSREYNVFLNHFQQEQRIRLHDLTKKDMERYVEDELTRGIRDYGTSESDVDSVVKHLVDSIVWRAQGIFLWVKLVVNDLCNQMENGSRPEDLHHEVDKLPEDIDRLFRHFMTSISHGESQKAYQTLDIIVSAQKWSIWVTLLSWNFLEVKKKDQPALSFESWVSRPRNNFEDVEVSKKRLNNCLRGLVEVTFEGNEEDEHLTNWYYLEVAHRSVAEFVAQEKETGNNCHNLDELDTLDALSYITVFSWRYQADYIEDTLHWYCPQISNLLFMRVECFSDTSNFDFFEGVASMIENHDPISERLNTTCERVEIESQIQAGYMSCECGGTYFSTGRRHKKLKIDNDGLVLELPSLRHMLLQGGYDTYEISKLQTTQGIAQSPGHVSLLASCIFTHIMNLVDVERHYYDSPDSEFGVAVIGSLLDQGHLSPDFEMHTWFWPLEEPEILADWRPTLLEVTCLAASILAGGDLITSIQGILERLLRHRGNPCFTIEANIEDDGKYTVSLERPGIGKRRLLLPELRGSKDEPPRIWYETTMLGTWQPRQIIQLSSFKNKETLLQLLDDQLGAEHIEAEDAMSLFQDDLEPQQDAADNCLGAKDLQHDESFPRIEDSLVGELCEVEQLVEAGESQLSKTAPRGEFISHPIFWAVIGLLTPDRRTVELIERC